MNPHRTIRMSLGFAFLLALLPAAFGCPYARSSDGGAGDGNKRKGDGPDSLLAGVTLGGPSPTSFGFEVCSQRPLHQCVARAGTRHGTREFPILDIAAQPACTDQVTLARARCSSAGGPHDTATLRCLAASGVLLDTFATGPRRQPPEEPGKFTLQCLEGRATIHFMEPL